MRRCSLEKKCSNLGGRRHTQSQPPWNPASPFTCLSLCCRIWTTGPRTCAAHPAGRGRHTLGGISLRELSSIVEGPVFTAAVWKEKRWGCLLPPFLSLNKPESRNKEICIERIGLFHYTIPKHIHRMSSPLRSRTHHALLKARPLAPAPGTAHGGQQVPPDPTL